MVYTTYLWWFGGWFIICFTHIIFSRMSVPLLCCFMGWCYLDEWSAHKLQRATSLLPLYVSAFEKNKEHLENNLNSMLLGFGFEYTSGFCSLEMFRHIERVANDLLLKGLIPRPASLSGDYPELLVLVIAKLVSETDCTSNIK